MKDNVQLQHPAGKKPISMDRMKYEMLKKALTNHLKINGPSTHTEIWRTVEEDFVKRKIKFEGNLQWHMEWVKLDLEAKKIIRRVDGSLPQKYMLIT